MATIRTKTHHLFLHRVWCKIGIMHGNAPRYGWPLPKRTAIFMIRYAQKRTNISRKSLVKKGSPRGRPFLGHVFPSGGLLLPTGSDVGVCAVFPLPRPPWLVCTKTHQHMHLNAPTGGCGDLAPLPHHFPPHLLSVIIYELAEAFNEDLSFESNNLWISWDIKWKCNIWVP